jgi:hypothetical protein
MVLHFGALRKEYSDFIITESQESNNAGDRAQAQWRAAAISRSSLADPPHMLRLSAKAGCLL